MVSQGKNVLLPVMQLVPKPKSDFESYSANYITRGRDKSLTLKELNTKHLFNIKALKNWEDFQWRAVEQRWFWYLHLLKLYQSICSFVGHTSFTTAWQRQDGSRNPNTSRVFLVPAEPC